ncbi:MAG: hypothetical protein ISQ09_03360 [Rubripirellula sp.]|nr:hypothetical protein [Rubripirellula sp.]
MPMLKTMLSALLLALTPCVFLSLSVSAEEAEGQKYSTEEIMKVGFKGGLLKKVAAGAASDEEKQKLHAMLVALSKNKVEKGDAESWKTLTSALVKASTAVMEGKDGAGDALQKASNCKACHNVHK